MTLVDAVILAGGKNSRAMTKLGNQTMLDYVVEALTQTPSIQRLFVVGNVPESDRYQTVPGKETLLQNVLAGLQAAGQTSEQERILISTSDIPFLTAASVDDFVAQSLGSGADFCYPIVPMALCRARFPEMKRTAAKVKEGEFTGGNLLLVNPRFLQTHQAAIERAYAARKSPLQMGRLLGTGLLLRVLLAQIAAPSVLPLARLEAGVGRVLGGCRAAAIITQFPEIGTDVDKPDDVVIARRLLAP